MPYPGVPVLRMLFLFVMVWLFLVENELLIMIIMNFGLYTTKLVDISKYASCQTRNLHSVPKMFPGPIQKKKKVHEKA